LLTVLFTLLYPYFAGERGPHLLVMFVSPEFATSTYGGIIVGSYLLLGKMVRRTFTILLLAVMMPFQLLLALIVVGHLIEGYPFQNSFLLPTIALVPIAAIYAAFEPAAPQNSN